MKCTVLPSPPGTSSSSRPGLALLLLSRQPGALHGQNEAAAAPARPTDPLCPGSRDSRDTSLCGDVASLAPKTTWEVPEASPSPLCRAQHGQVSWLGSLVLYRPAQVSEDRIKPQAGGGGEESFVVVLWLESKAAAGLSRWREGRGIWRTCLGWLAPVSHHLTHSRRQSLAQQHRDIQPTGDRHRQRRLLPGITPGHHRALAPVCGTKRDKGILPEITKLLHVSKLAVPLLWFGCATCATSPRCLPLDGLGLVTL